MATPTKSETTFEEVIDRELGRRSFLKLTAMGIVSAVAATLPAEIGEAAKEVVTKRKVRYGMVIDLQRCILCRACVIACKQENKTPPGMLYNPVLEEETGEYPKVGRRWFPRPCNHCEKPACLEASPHKAIFQTY